MKESPPRTQRRETAEADRHDQPARRIAYREVAVKWIIAAALFRLFTAPMNKDIYLAFAVQQRVWPLWIAALAGVGKISGIWYPSRRELAHAR